MATEAERGGRISRRARTRGGRWVGVERVGGCVSNMDMVGGGADRRGGAISTSGDEFDFHTGDDRTPASAKVSQGGSGRAGEKKRLVVAAKSGLWQRRCCSLT